jgi:anthranilate synthase component I
MHKPGLNKFIELAEKGTLIPVYKEHLADMETPVSVLNRIRGSENAFLLESVEGGEHWARYSFLGFNPYAMFTVEDGIPYLTQRNGSREALEFGPDGPMSALRDILKDKPVELPELPPLFAGAIGYLTYETVNEFERLPAPKSPLTGPTSCFMLTDEMAVFDNVRHTVKIVASVRPADFQSLEAAYDAACHRIDEIESILKTPAEHPQSGSSEPVELESNMTREEFKSMVETAKEYIVKGDIIQAVLSQKFSTELTVEPIQIYRALRLINPSPYMFYLKFADRILIGASPEVMVRLTGDRAEVRPIAGTRHRGQTEQIDRELADDLLSDEKERAEHLMLVDLGRNDLGRTAVPASVKVREFMTIERYSHVMHLVSNVESVLDRKYDAFDLVRTTFPAGTLSGAPKIRAMEIIHELEPEPRGVYGGAVGYFNCNGNMDIAITIRTLEIFENKISVQAGAGIVYDSDPDKEFEETVHKANAIIKALESAARNLEIV